MANQKFKILEFEQAVNITKKFLRAKREPTPQNEAQTRQKVLNLLSSITERKIPILLLFSTQEEKMQFFSFLLHKRLAFEK